MKAHKAGKLGDIGKTQRPLTEIGMELARTKKELAEEKIERIMSMPASWYYAWVVRPLSKRAREEMCLELDIKAADKRTRQLAIRDITEYIEIFYNRQHLQLLLCRPGRPLSWTVPA